MSSDDDKKAVERELIAIIGLGGCFPDATDVPTFWQNICQGHVAIREVPTERWDPELYYSEDRKAPDRTYSKIGAFVSEVPFDRKRFRMPPRTAVHIDDTQKMALTAVAEALHDAGLEAFPGSGQGRAFERERTAVILGNSMGGQSEDLTNLRVWFPEVKKILLESEAMASVSPALRDSIVDELETRYKANLPTVTEDSMPGELSNCIAGRVANAFNLRGPNYTTDAACAASMAAMKTAIDGLSLGDYDVAIVGGSDQQMDPPTFVKFSKIGALSAQHSAPFDARADGFVMGEGAGVLVLKRLSDAERDGDRVYAVVRGVGAASDGKGKGITAPNPIGQKLAVERAYEVSGVEMNSVGLFEAHGTSTKVGDRVELEVLTELLRKSGGQPKHVPIGSVKSMIGHLKSAAGAAALIKSTLSLYHEKLPPSANFQSAASDSPLTEGYLEVNTELRDWPATEQPRRAGVSAFGFGGTNFHVVLEEYQASGGHQAGLTPKGEAVMTSSTVSGSAMASAGGDRAQLLVELTQLFAEQTGYEVDELEPEYQLEADLGIDTVKQAEIFAIIRERYELPQSDDFKLADVQTLTLVVEYVMGNRAVPAAHPAQPAASLVAEAPTSHGPTVIVFGAASREALIAKAREVHGAAQTFPADFDRARREAAGFPCRLGFVAESIEEVGKKINDAEKRSNRILAARGIYLTEGAELASGKTAFLFPGQGSQYIGMLRDLSELYPVVADTFKEGNEILRPLIGGMTLTDLVWPEGVDAKDQAASAALQKTEICQPAMLTADIALMRLLQQFGIEPDYVVGHSLGEYAACVASGVMTFAEALYAVSARGREMASVQVEDCGKMASVPLEAASVDAVLEGVDGYVISANKNCRKQTVIAGSSDAVEAAVERFSEQGVDARLIPVSHAFHCEIVAPAAKPLAAVLSSLDLRAPSIPILSNVHAGPYPTTKQEIVDLLATQLESPVEFIAQLEALYDADVRTFVEVGPRRAITGFVHNIFEGRPYVGVFTNHHKKAGQLGFLEALAAIAASGVEIDFSGTTRPRPLVRPDLPTQALQPALPVAKPANDPLVVSGVSIALPMERPVGYEGEDVFSRILRGENFISDIGDEHRQAILEKNVVRLEKSSGEFNRMTELGQVIQLAGQLGDLNLVDEFGLDANFNDALDSTSRLAIAVGIEALKDAGVPLVRRYRTTSTGKKLADGWALPTEVGNRTGVIFASAFPGVDRIIEDVSQHVASKYAAQSEASLRELVDSLASAVSADEGEKIRSHFESHLGSLREEADLYAFNRKFLFRILSMGHAQLAQVIGARGPNTQVNAACASGAQAIAIGSDWIEQGRCDRVIVVTADDATHPSNLPWIGTGFLAAGAATTEKDPAQAALPFGAKRDGMIVGSGAACFVLERDSMVAERGMEPLVDVLATLITNTAFHATRLESGFIRDSFETFVAEVAAKREVSVEELGRDTFFMSHETYTPARGGSSAAEVNALRHAFQGSAADVLIANTKGFTGHPMGASLEDAVAIKGLQRQELPPVANLSEVDPDFADLNFSRGGGMERSVAIRFAAGFGSQVAMVAYGRRATQEARLVDPAAFQAWIAREAGVDGASYEVTHRTFRVAEKTGKDLMEVGVPSLRQAVVERAPVEVEPAVVEPVAVEPRAALPVALPREDLAAQITQLFAEQTGYEVDELDPTYLLEADLGIDTVKQAEIFGILRETYGMSRDESFNLSDVQTLTAVVDYVQSQSGTAGAAAPAVSEAATVAAPVPAIAEPVPTAVVVAKDEGVLLEELTGLFAEQTGYEPDELEPDYQLEADLGIDTVKQAEIFAIIRERYGIGQDDNFELAAVQTLRAVVGYVSGAMGGTEVLAEPASVVSVEAPDVEVVETTPVATQTRDVPADLLGELTALFAEQTGYEPDELEPSYQLEADLGIDTVKQAEIFGIIRERYGIAQDDNFNLSDVQTLTEVVGYVESQMGGAAALELVPAPAAVAEAVAPKNEQSPVAILVELTELFATETGYEVDELEPTYQLEADLGIDTVKQAEIFAILRKRYGLPQDDAFKLADYQTLNAIADYIITMMGGDHEPPPGTKAAEPVEKTRELDLGAFSARGVGVVHSPKSVPSTASVEGRRWLIVARDEVIGEALRLELQIRGASAVELTTSVAAGINHFERSTRFDGFAWLGFGGGASRAALGDVFELVRNFAASRRGDFKGVALLLAAPSDGVFGHFEAKGIASLTPGLAGIAKSMTKEWPEGRAVAVDVESSVREPRKVARMLADELVSQGPSEVALYRGQRLTLQRLAPVSFDGPYVHTTGTVVATGGARGVTFELLRELAQISPRKMVILARTLGVSQDESPIFGRTNDEKKAAARAALDSKAERVTPVVIKRWIEREEKRLEVTENLEQLRGLGCEVVALGCDVSDEASLRDAAASIKRNHGPVALLVHGAGIEESKLIQDKDVEAFERTFKPKADALSLLLEALEPTRTLAMGSVAGRFGNGGQADYSAANEWMGSLARSSQSGMVNVCWTAWADVGMATRGSVGKVLTESGVELLPAELGARVGAWLASSDVTGDVVVSGALGAFAGIEQDAPRVYEVTSERPEAPALFDSHELVGEVGQYTRHFDPAVDVGLRDHSIDGVPLLPGVLGVELITQAVGHYAQAAVRELGGVEFTSPIKFFDQRALDVSVEVSEESDGRYRAEVVTYFKRPNGKLMRRLHFRSVALTGAPKASPDLPSRLEMPRDPKLSSRAIYERYFHGPVFQVLSEVSRLGEDGVELEMNIERAEWLGGFSLAGFVSEPHMREVGFQAAGIWEMAELSRMGLPAAVEHIYLSDEPIPQDAHVSVRRCSTGGDGASFDIWVHDGRGRIFEMMQGYRTATLRPLRREERFEPVTSQAEVPNWVTVKLTDVEAMLDSERDRTLQKYLSEEEKKTFLGLKTAKRRRDWLSGRIAAKRLIREEHFGRDGAIVPYGAISIVPDPLGAPTVVIVGEGILPIRISISHSDGIAAALLSTDETVRPGIDVEVVESRHASWAESYFTERERAWAERDENTAAALTAMWAIKEAYLKALGIGARVDFRDMNVSFDGSQWHVEVQGDVESRLREVGGQEADIRVDKTATRAVARVFLQTVGTGKDSVTQIENAVTRGERSH